MPSSDSPVALLTRCIADHLAEWDVAHVELATHGSDDPGAIATALEAFCGEHLGAGVARPIFYQSSIGAVAGLELRDGRCVVVKAHQPNVSRATLEEMVRLERHLAERGLFAPTVLAGPAPIGCGLATVEKFVDVGETRDAHVPAIRRGLARALHAVVDALAPLAKASSLPTHLLAPEPGSPLWPTPHSRLFDFDATCDGAEDIDDVAAWARDQAPRVGRIVLGHGDWRAEHVRFVGDAPVMAFDWDSLRKEAEPALVGFTAHAFCADFSRDDHAQAPTLAEARSFVSDYEAARGGSFETEERRLCGAAFAYSVAYSARCAHARGRDERRQIGTFQHLIATYGRGLSEL